jgi:iron-sulfur cluster repair protein YtfE (RIC family)
MTAPPITAEMSILDILEKFPATTDIFKRYNITPNGYRAMAYETLSASAQVHQIELNALLNELNRTVS